MIFKLLIIASLIILFLLFVYRFKEHGFIEAIVDSMLYGLLLLLTNAILGLILYVAIGINSNIQLELDKTEYLISLQNKTTTGGEFFLGSGKINSKLEYYYATKNGDEISIKSIENDENVVIIETEEKPRIETYSNVFTNQTVIWLLGDKHTLSKNKIKIYIPKNSLKVDYNIDLNK